MTRPLALITGGTKRVGLAIAATLADSGFDLALHYRSDPAAAEAAAAALRTRGAHITLHPADLADLASADAFARSLADTLPRLDALVLNASSYRPTPLTTLTPAQLTAEFNVNAAAPALLAVRLADRLRASDYPAGPSIVAMLDIHALGRPRRDHLAYAMSKAALNETVRTLARELAPRVRVNALAPGVIAWPDSGPDADPDFQARYLARVPLARAGTPQDAADAACWLITSARYTTGQVIRVDGGRWLT